MENPIETNNIHLKTKILDSRDDDQINESTSGLTPQSEFIPDENVDHDTKAQKQIRSKTSLEIPRGFVEIKTKEQNKKKRGKANEKEEVGEQNLNLKELMKMEYYELSGLDLETPEKSIGLSEDEFLSRIQKYGKNQLKKKKKKPEILKFFQHFLGFFPLLLIGGGTLCWISVIFEITSYQDEFLYHLDNVYLGSVLYFVVVLTCVVSYLQESKSDKIMKSFEKLIPKNCTVIRNGKETIENITQIVVGDLVKLKNGDYVPADMRMISVNRLKVDNSVLTGEAELVTIRTEAQKGVNKFNSTNLCFFGTYVAEGSGIGLVVSTGSNTMMGKVAKLADDTKKIMTPLQKEIKRFVLIIAGIAVSLGLCFFVLNIFMNIGNSFFEAVSIPFLIGIIVANVPEGLLTTVTLSLTLSAKRMSKKNVLVKNLESVETLGSTTVICTDKTGTLTKNKMSVSHLFFDDCIWDAKGNDGKKIQELFKHDPKHYNEKKKNGMCSMSTGEIFFDICVLCNKAVFDNKTDFGERKIIGDASETALLNYFVSIMKNNHMKEEEGHDGIVAKFDCDEELREFRRQNPVLGNAEIPFNSTNKFQISVHKMACGRTRMLMKGAPERIIQFCSKYLFRDTESVLVDELKDRIENANFTLASMGERVLGICYYEFKKDDPVLNIDFNDPVEVEKHVKMPRDDMVFVGLVSLIDPPKDGTKRAVEISQRAGVKVIMITGDHPTTALAIGKQVSIVGGYDDGNEVVKKEKNVVNLCKEEDFVNLSIGLNDAVVIHGSFMKLMTKEVWDKVLAQKEVIFARTSPQQKLEIVQNLQRRGEVVAIVGDGVNDSPALKKANIGISMGISGSDVSKNSADIILVDDNFASIVSGVEEGRIIFDNLKKSIAYTLSSNIPEIIPFLLFITLGIPLPLGTILILCIDLGTDILPAISFAYERAESDIMHRPPRDGEKDNLVTTKLIGFSYFTIGVIQALAGLYAYAFVMGEYGFSLASLIQMGRIHFQSSSISEDAIMQTNPLRDSFGIIRDWSYQMTALKTAQTAVFVSIVVVQWADLLICKTRIKSLFTQGMKNSTAVWGLVFETVLAFIIVYVPPMNWILGTAPLNWYHWILAFPFAILIFLIDEFRKFIIRNIENSWLERFTLW